MERITKEQVKKMYTMLPEGASLIINPFPPRFTRIIGDHISTKPAMYEGYGI